MFTIWEIDWFQANIKYGAGLKSQCPTRSQEAFERMGMTCLYKIFQLDKLAIYNISTTPTKKNWKESY